MSSEVRETPAGQKDGTGFPIRGAAIAAGALVVFLAVRGGGDPFQGTWTLDMDEIGPELDRQMSAQGLPALNLSPGKMPDFLVTTFGYSDSSLELRADKTYSLTYTLPLMNRTETGTWTAQKENLFMKPAEPGRPPINGRRQGRRLLLESRGLFGQDPIELPYER